MECNKFYDRFDLDKVRRKARNCSFSNPIINEAKLKYQRIGTIKKVDTPNYEHVLAKDKLQARKYDVSSPKAAKINFYQQYINKRKFIPGVGHYKNADIARDKIGF